MEANHVTHTELDLSLRLVEVWYDITWAYYTSSSVDHVAKRIDRRRRAASSTASVASTIAEGTTAGKTLREKLYILEKNLKNAKVLMKPRQFEDICKVSLRSNDDLYPGFKDILLIAKHLLVNSEEYQGTLTPEEVNGLTLTFVFQNIYYQLCDFLLTTRVGREAMKLIIMPSKITHATYDICRQKFCRLLCDETSIVQYGLFHMIKKVIHERDEDDEASARQPEVTPEEPTPEATAPPEAPEAIVETEAVEELPQAPEAIVETEASDVASFSSNVRKPSFATVPFHAAMEGSLKFPVISLSSDDDDDESSVSSLEDEI